eukprot:PhM_4_TR18264/c0_g1_i1/m.54735
MRVDQALLLLLLATQRLFLFLLRCERLNQGKLPRLLRVTRALDDRLAVRGLGLLPLHYVGQCVVKLLLAHNVQLHVGVDLVLQAVEAVALELLVLRTRLLDLICLVDLLRFHLKCRLLTQLLHSSAPLLLARGSFHLLPLELFRTHPRCVLRLAIDLPIALQSFHLFCGNTVVCRLGGLRLALLPQLEFGLALALLVLVKLLLVHALRVLCHAHCRLARRRFVGTATTRNHRLRALRAHGCGVDVVSFLRVGAVRRRRGLERRVLPLCLEHVHLCLALLLVVVVAQLGDLRQHAFVSEVARGQGHELIGGDAVSTAHTDTPG